MRDDLDDLDEVLFAVQFAARCHAGQVDKIGAPYFFHPLRVMFRVGVRTTDPSSLITAVLHDVVEDTPVQIEDIGRLFGNWVRDCVDALTRRPDEDYMAYIERLRPNPLAALVKRMDLEDNLERMPQLEEGMRKAQLLRGRGKEVVVPDAARLKQRYIKALEVLHEGSRH